MEGQGPYLWINKYAPPAGFHRVPPGGMCIGVFLFVRRGRRLLLCKVRDHPAWQDLAGEDPSRMRADAGRWKLPARQLRLGEDPREAARQIGEEILGLTRLRYGEPRVEVEFWKLGDQASGPSARRRLFHYDMWFLVDAALPPSVKVRPPAWFSELSWQDPGAISKKGWARFHDDVVARWKRRRPTRGPEPRPRTRAGFSTAPDMSSTAKSLDGCSRSLVPMQSGRGKAKVRGAGLRIDRSEVEEEIRRNRESNERFKREYSAWFEARSAKGRKRRRAS